MEGLDQLLPNVEAPGFVLKENPEDPDIGLILKLLEQEPELKRALVDLTLFGPRRRSFYADGIVNY